MRRQGLVVMAGFVFSAITAWMVACVPAQPPVVTPPAAICPSALQCARQASDQLHVVMGPLAITPYEITYDHAAAASLIAYIHAIDSTAPEYAATHANAATLKAQAITDLLALEDATAGRGPAVRLKLDQVLAFLRAG